ncbi:o-succinylbenzoate synthase [Quadrisphaera sp. DSM 44207]|uniref:o-succinylbenzoate synthase n=1 Tax=Quadrisphaera sp. DSM 44207 TaxID=1881057 RepID=UPI0008840989|nr:o-succinylbenzoate synthase [Quadrisphaera sp. DSM 44207]SDQ15306.1 O-succinylbenzoate synthase [Quadrisphaera sp. DSM 44207]
MHTAASAPPPPPPLDDVLASAAVVALPLRVPFRGLDVREAVLVRGPAGWGEFAPFAEYDDAESAPWLAAALEAAWSGWPAPRRPRVPVNATVPAVAPQQVAGVLAAFPGCTTAKVKVAQRGQDLADDLARVARVRELLGDGGRVRVDANGAWSVERAVRALTALAAGGPVEYAEQPCASVPELAELRARLAAAGVAVPVAADESVRRAADPLAVARAGAADVAVLKVAPLGGVRPLLALAERLRGEHGMPVVVSSALDTAVGVAAGLAAAAALPEPPPACGLGTGGLLAADVAAPAPLAAGTLPAGPVAADPALLAARAAAPARRAWWLQRLRRCHALLAPSPP